MFIYYLNCLTPELIALDLQVSFTGELHFCFIAIHSSRCFCNAGPQVLLGLKAPLPLRATSYINQAIMITRPVPVMSQFTATAQPGPSIGSYSANCQIRIAISITGVTNAQHTTQYAHHKFERGPIIDSMSRIKFLI